MKIVIGDIEIIADSYKEIPKEKTVIFYRNRSDLDYIPPIRIDAELLSDFGEKVVCE